MVTGEYSWVDPFGTRHVIVYKADETGFNIVEQREEKNAVEIKDEEEKPSVIRRNKDKKLKSIKAAEVKQAAPVSVPAPVPAPVLAPALPPAVPTLVQAPVQFNEAPVLSSNRTPKRIKKTRKHLPGVSSAAVRDRNILAKRRKVLRVVKKRRKIVPVQPAIGGPVVVQPSVVNPPQIKAQPLPLAISNLPQVVASPSQSLPLPVSQPAIQVPVASVPLLSQPQPQPIPLTIQPGVRPQTIHLTSFEELVANSQLRQLEQAQTAAKPTLEPKATIAVQSKAQVAQPSFIQNIANAKKQHAQPVFLVQTQEPVELQATVQQSQTKVEKKLEKKEPPKVVDTRSQAERQLEIIRIQEKHKEELEVARKLQVRRDKIQAETDRKEKERKQVLAAMRKQQEQDLQAARIQGLDASSAPAAVNQVEVVQQEVKVQDSKRF